ncbi:MAG: bifunctional phosphopantothenoylcysteine decarboxylase/phosphopantothenate--cysteine ligase CoaBC [Bacteroidales bacterium]
MLKGKKILIGITGSIAAYKIPLLIRLLVREGAEVRVVMTEMARDFVTPLTLSTLCGHPVYGSFFDREDGSWHSHVDLGRWADLYLIAPASATTLSKMASGQADNLLMAVFLAAKCPVMIAPAMDVDMYLHPATQENIKRLRSFGYTVIDPEEGELASGLVGPGRLPEPEAIFEKIHSFFVKKKRFKGKTVVVTAGPTYENIDPVRFIGNYSSGKMGFALARAFAGEGARVVLISGPVAIDVSHPAIERINIRSAEELHKAVSSAAGNADIIVMAAAVADYKPASSAGSKIKRKSGEKLTLELEPNPDILAGLGKVKKEGQILAGFALETDDELENARNKLQNKNLDLIVLNSLRDEGAGFGTDTNKISIITKDGEVMRYGLNPKNEVACDIVDKIAEIAHL